VNNDVHIKCDCCPAGGPVVAKITAGTLEILKRTHGQNHVARIPLEKLGAMGIELQYPTRGGRDTLNAGQKSPVGTESQGGRLIARHCLRFRG
jgi:hypothetical protein